MSFWASAAMIGAGLVAGKAKNDKAQEIENKTRDAAQAQEKYSWITGQKPQEIQRAGSLFGDELQGATSGLAMGQGLRSANNANELNKAQMEHWAAVDEAARRNGAPVLYGGGLGVRATPGDY